MILVKLTPDQHRVVLKALEVRERKMTRKGHPDLPVIGDVILRVMQAGRPRRPSTNVDFSNPVAAARFRDVVKAAGYHAKRHSYTKDDTTSYPVFIYWHDWQREPDVEALRVQAQI